MAEEDVEEEGSGGGKKKFIIIIVVVLLLLGGAGAAYYFMFMGDDKEEALNPGQTTEEQAESESGTQGDPANPIFTPPAQYTVNLRDGKHFIKLSLVAVLEDPAALAYLAQRMAYIDDRVISLLYNMTTADLRTQAGIELLKRELYKEANSIFTHEFIMESDTQDQFPVKKILFKEFLIN
ncbi:MAG: flagellar basal body-associated FliL family protein [Deltaproteobacteria bacterium]|jgi:flagellar protein FliL|nr:flagellar basal body-associated FliL family protein [Deltaproteobacteria bacterium]MBT4525817.1 flagellar basal body-associated FliL family protein [Deltaproteobacteria bacterium]